MPGTRAADPGMEPNEADARTLPRVRAGVLAHRMRPWFPVAAGIVATLVLATGVGVGVQAALDADQPPPTLRTVPQSTLDRLGISLASASPMPYCGLRGVPLVGRVVGTAPLGCPITRSQAIQAAQGPISRTVVEALLARVTAPGQPTIGRDHLAWLVVLRGWPHPVVRPCAIMPGTPSVCPMISVPIVTGPSLVVVDARSAQVLVTYWLGNPRPVPFPVTSAPVGRKVMPGMVGAPTTVAVAAGGG